MRPQAARVAWVVSLAVLGSLLGPGPDRAHADGWKAGTARVAITPGEPMWMAGYASRNKPSEGAVHDLWAKALVLEDPSGRKAALVTLDVCGIGRDLPEHRRDLILEIRREQREPRKDLGQLRVSEAGSGFEIAQRSLAGLRAKAAVFSAIVEMVGLALPTIS